MTREIIEVNNIPSMVSGGKDPIPGNIYGLQEWEQHLGLGRAGSVYFKNSDNGRRTMVMDNGVLIYRHRLNHPFPTTRAQQKKVTITSADGFTQEVKYVVPLCPNGDMRWGFKEENGKLYVVANPTVGDTRDVNGKGRLYYAINEGRNNPVNTHWLTWNSIPYEYINGKAELDNIWSEEVKSSRTFSLVWVDLSRHANPVRKDIAQEPIPKGYWNLNFIPSPWVLGKENTLKLALGPVNYPRSGTARVLYEILNAAGDSLFRSDYQYVPVVNNTGTVTHKYDDFDSEIFKNAHSMMYYVDMEGTTPGNSKIALNKVHIPRLSVTTANTVRVGQDVTFTVMADKNITANGWLHVEWRESAPDYVGTPVSNSVRVPFSFNNSSTATTIANISKLVSNYTKKPTITYVITATATLNIESKPGTYETSINVENDKYTGGWTVNAFAVGKHTNNYVLRADDPVNGVARVRVIDKGPSGNPTFTKDYEVVISNGQGNFNHLPEFNTTRSLVEIRMDKLPFFSKELSSGNLNKTFQMKIECDLQWYTKTTTTASGILFGNRRTVTSQELKLTNYFSNTPGLDYVDFLKPSGDRPYFHSDITRTVEEIWFKLPDVTDMILTKTTVEVPNITYIADRTGFVPYSVYKGGYPNYNNNSTAVGFWFKLAVPVKVNVSSKVRILLDFTPKAPTNTGLVSSTP